MTMTHAINRRASPFDDVCRCDHDWLDDELEELVDDDFDEDPCPICGGRVVMTRSIWREEEDDC